jgi:hypothetical protein
MPRLEDFREMIDAVHDQKVLESGQTLLREMMEINDLRRKLQDLEDNLTNGGKAIFYFFAEELDEDELVFATERISGRIRRIERIESSKEVESSSGGESDEGGETSEVK